MQATTNPAQAMTHSKGRLAILLRAPCSRRAPEPMLLPLGRCRKRSHRKCHEPFSPRPHAPSIQRPASAQNAAPAAPRGPPLPQKPFTSYYAFTVALGQKILYPYGLVARSAVLRRTGFTSTSSSARDFYALVLDACGLHVTSWAFAQAS